MSCNGYRSSMSTMGGMGTMNGMGGMVTPYAYPTQSYPPAMAQPGTMMALPSGMAQPGMMMAPPAAPSYPGVGTTMPYPPPATSGDVITPAGTVFPTPTFEQSYVENILRLNLGKIGTFYMTYENNSQWNAKIFKGIVEAAGRDHIIISDPVTGIRTILLMVNLDYITFDEPLVYSYPGVMGTTSMPTKSAR